VLRKVVPSEERFLRVFRAPAPKQLEVAFRRWVAEVVGALKGGVAIVGKTVRGSGSAGETTIRMVSALATELGIVLGQEKVAAMSNEITDQGRDYLLAMKGNQPAPPEAIKTNFIDQYQLQAVSRNRRAHKSRGRIVSALPAKGTADLADWPKCKTIVLVGSSRKVGDEESDSEQRYYIRFRKMTAEQSAVAVRGHWAVENRLHRVLDASFERGCQHST
jgi:predicted transposase YbfD/YdcC